MNTTELKKLSEAATTWDMDTVRAFQEAANPAAILKLLEINAELLKALKWIKSNPDVHPANLEKIIDAFIATAKGGEL